MKLIATVCLALFLAAPAIDAAGGSSKEEEPQSNDRMAEADRFYNKGLMHRDRAWEYEKQAEGAKTDEQRQVYLDSADREWERAVEAFEKATKQYSRHHEAFGSLGYARRKLGRYEASLKAYDRALAMEPEYAEAREYRAEAYMKLGKFDKAKSDYAKLVKIDKKQARTFLSAASKWIEGKGAEQDTSSFAAWVKEEKEKLGPGESASW